MKIKDYDKIVNVCVACGVASALLFGEAGRFSPLVGTLGILSGFVATAVYFTNRWPSTRAKLEQGEVASDLQGEIVSLEKAVVAEPTRQDVGPSSNEFVLLFEAKVHEQVIGHVVHPHFLPNLFVEPRTKASYFSPHQALHQDEFIDRLVNIVKQLTEEEGPRYEFILGTDGNLTIRPAEEPAAGSIERRRLARSSRLVQ